MAHQDLHTAHPGALTDGDRRHGFIYLHPYSAKKTKGAAKAVEDAAKGRPRDPVTVDSVHDLVLVLVEDTKTPPMNGTDFHNYLDRLKGKYLALNETSTRPWFSFGDWF